MRRPRWPYVIMLVVGAALGVAIAGVPTRGQDPPLRVQTETTSTTVPAAEAPEPQTPATTAPQRTTTTTATTTTRRPRP